jgi:hypothetical protein
MPLEAGIRGKKKAMFNSTAGSSSATGQRGRYRSSAISTGEVRFAKKKEGAMKSKKMLRMLAVPVALAFVAASCGSDDGDSADDTTAATEAAPVGTSVVHPWYVRGLPL